VKGGPQTWDELPKKPVGVERACISLDGTRIAAVFAGGTLCIYDTTTGEPILPPFKVDSNLRSVIFSRDGKLVATGGQALQLWNVETGEEFESLDIDVYSLALSPVGTCIAAGCAGRYLWDGNDRKDGSYNIRVINLELSKISYTPIIPFRRERIRRLKGEVWPSPFEGHKGDVFSVAYSADGKRIASSSDDWTVRVWDVSTGSRRTFKTNSMSICSVAFSPDSTQIAADGTLIDLSTGILSHLEEKLVISSAFSADGRFIASATYRSAACQIWDASTHQTIIKLVGHTGSVPYVAFFPDGKKIMSASWDGTIRVWDIELLEERREMDRWQVNRWDWDEYWIRGPEREHIFWSTLPFRHARNTLVIGECPNIDFSKFVHGDDWVRCQEPLVEQRDKRVPKGWK
jgi:WD40 repeat protein